MEIRNVVVPDLYQQGLLNSHSVYTSPIFQPFQPEFQTYNLSIKGKTFFSHNLHTTNKPAWLLTTGHNKAWFSVQANRLHSVTTQEGSWLSWFHAQKAHSYCSMYTTFFFLFFYFLSALDTVNRGDHLLGNLSQTHLCSLHFS